MTRRAPVVKYDPATPDAPDVGVRPARRGEDHRTIRVHFHAEDGRPGSDAVLRVYRDADGAPVIEVDALAAGGHLLINPDYGEAAAEIAAARVLRATSPTPPAPTDQDFWAVWRDVPTTNDESTPACPHAGPCTPWAPGCLHK